MSNPTCYNKRSGRACGNRLYPTRTCSHCREPVNWKCSGCPNVDDSTHAHLEAQNQFAEGIVH